ncbi:FHA domain-containing protein [Herbiconiux sp. YIM B11900]|uniref:FHA domain-containing protein n=1 Tax=Herbiconiux sp. YIM B11900 TaxID=3404131 RepID=UPI003F865CDA
MTSLRYTPGEWRAIVAPSGLALLPASVEASTLEELWSALSEGAGLGAVLESLSGAFGTSLSSIPPFAVATVSGDSGDSGDSGGSVRLAVRGGLAIEVSDASGTYAVSGAEVTTWSERVVTGGIRLRLRPDSASALSAEIAGPWFPIASGVVLAAAVDVQLTADAVAPTAAPAATSAAAAGGASAEAAPVGTASLGSGTSDGVPESQGTDAADVEEAVGVDETVSVEETVIPESTALPEAPGTPDVAEVPDVADAETGETGLDDELVHTRTELPDDAYDHLWGATVVKSVEEAAVREVDDEDEEAAAVTPAAAPVVTPAPDDADAAREQNAASAAESAPAAPGFAPSPTAPAPTAPPVSGGLIDGVPDFGGLGAASGSSSINGRTVPPIAPAPAPLAAASSPSSPATAPSAVGPAATGADFDHDGLTVTVSELEAMRRLGGASGTDPAAGAPAATPVGGLGRIVLSTGETHTLDRPIIIGRRPRANRVQADQVPVLITVASPEQDISRNHLEIRIEGRHVLVVDLDTTNGSVLHREGTPPLRLGPNEPVLVLSDDVVDLGDGITVAFEDVP